MRYVFILLLNVQETYFKGQLSQKKITERASNTINI